MAERAYYGGQAVIEGVMMRGQKTMVTVVRHPKGNLVMNIKPLSALYTGRLRKTPFLRGIVVLIEAMVLGIGALMYSANVALEEEVEEGSAAGKLLWLSVLGALVFAVGLFFLTPLFLTKLLEAYISSSLVFNLIEGGIRLSIFIAYLIAVGLMPDIKRVFAYHGAEHKTVNAYEHGVPLEVEAVRKHDTAHVRCGTSFLFVVLMIAILVFALVGMPSLWLMVLSRIVLIPVIAAIGYEVTHFAGRHADNGWVRAILAPGLWLQALTTREPDEGQLEVAVAALGKVVEIDGMDEAAAAGS
ncbi:MAG: DUF1385 domain-containing protein [Chloroflexi bacterium]|nr:DUF1385 domain-containing protein [Chloroflexota bacterium]